MTARSKFLLLLAFFAAPMVAAWLAYVGMRPATHRNYGDLLPVAPLPAATGRTSDGRAFALDRLRGKWVMVLVGPAACDARCARQLYFMRQVRTAQGKDQERIERLWVVSDAGVPEPALLAAHPGLIVWRPDDAAFAARFFLQDTAARPIFLIDPLGNLMMRFPDPVDPKRMMKDLNLLLKASMIG
jgi:hypothetical protein